MASNTWWHERPQEQHIRDARESLSPRVLTIERFFENYTAAQLAYLIHMRYVETWPWELTRRGLIWWRNGGKMPSDTGPVWQEEHTCDESSTAAD